MRQLLNSRIRFNPNAEIEVMDDFESGIIKFLEKIHILTADEKLAISELKVPPAQEKPENRLKSCLVQRVYKRLKLSVEYDGKYIEPCFLLLTSNIAKRFFWAG